MAIDIQLIGKKWRTHADTIDGFKVISVDLQLAVWEDNSPLGRYMWETVFGGWPIGVRLHEEDLYQIINAIRNNRSEIYGEDSEQAEKDLITFIKVEKWYMAHRPYISVELEIM